MKWSQFGVDQDPPMWREDRTWSPTDLSKNELEALRILWERKNLKPAEIQESFSWTIENATLRSILVNLVEKGHVTRRLHGKAYRYEARVPKATLLQATSRALARVFSGGSIRELLLRSWWRTEDIGSSDIEIIQATAAEKNHESQKEENILEYTASISSFPRLAASRRALDRAVRVSAWLANAAMRAISALEVNLMARCIRSGMPFASRRACSLKGIQDRRGCVAHER